MYYQVFGARSERPWCSQEIISSLYFSWCDHADLKKKLLSLLKIDLKSMKKTMHTFIIKIALWMCLCTYKTSVESNIDIKAKWGHFFTATLRLSLRLLIGSFFDSTTNKMYLNCYYSFITVYDDSQMLLSEILSKAPVLSGINNVWIL